MMSNITLSTTEKKPSKPAPAAQRIVIQGIRGAFHEMAAKTLFGDGIVLVEALNFPELFALAADPLRAEAAVLAIENSIAGSILGNYRLLEQYDLQIGAETYLRIEQHLLANKGVQLEEIREVHSHPMALAQCEAFLDRHPWIRRVESEDTAQSAARIALEGRRDQAAIAGALAAELYGMNILARGIETNKVNFTRFLSVHRSDLVPEVRKPDKITVRFRLPHQPGSLSRVLAMLAAQSANLTKIQSVPLAGQLGEYLFFLDLTLENPATIPETIRLLEVFTQDCRVLGIYKRWKPESHPSFNHL